MDQPTLTRRDVLKLSAVAATALAVPLTVSLSAKQASELPANRLPKVFARPFATPKVVDLTGGGSQTLYQQMFNAHILDGGLTTRMFGYSTSADPNTATFPGPTILTSQGKSVDITQVNNLPGVHPFLGYEPSTSTHLHGHPSFPEFDGYANDLSHPAGRGLPAQSKTYTYENDTEPRTLWYHDHGVHHTAQNVYMGMAAQYWLTSPEERATPLPKGAFELPLIISDAAFQSNGDLLFDDRSTAGVNGDVILVNGVPWPVLKVLPRTYRFRLLDASIARGYRLRLSTGQPMFVVGTDGGLVRNPQPVTELRVGMAERYELVIDFAKHRGERIELQNLGVPNS